MSQPRVHGKCWNGEMYVHEECIRHTGKKCIEPGCTHEAGTKWTDLWCPDHDVERMERIDAGFQKIKDSFAPRDAGQIKGLETY